MTVMAGTNLIIENGDTTHHAGANRRSRLNFQIIQMRTVFCKPTPYRRPAGYRGKSGAYCRLVADALSESLIKPILGQ